MCLRLSTLSYLKKSRIKELVLLELLLLLFCAINERSHHARKVVLLMKKTCRNNNRCETNVDIDLFCIDLTNKNDLNFCYFHNKVHYKVSHFLKR